MTKKQFLIALIACYIFYVISTFFFLAVAEKSTDYHTWSKDGAFAFCVMGIGGTIIVMVVLFSSDLPGDKSNV